ncbi:MAG: HlyD family secretion protein, partial [Mesonia sp.]
MKNIKIIISVSIISILFSCANNEKADGYGNFEATEITVSSEANGKLEFLNVEEGQVLEKGETIGLVDTLQLSLNKQQLQASKATVASKSGGVWSQVSVLNQQ